MGRMPAASFRLLLIQVQITGAVNKAFINGVDMHILWRHIAQINGVNQRRDPFILRHPGNGNNIADLRLAGGFIEPDSLLRLEKAGSGGNSYSFQSWGNRKTYGLIRPGRICYQKPGFQRIQAPVNTFNGSIVGLQINTNVNSGKGKFFRAFYRRFFILGHYLTLPVHRGHPLPLADLDVINVRHS